MVAEWEFKICEAEVSNSKLAPGADDTVEEWTSAHKDKKPNLT